MCQTGQGELEESHAHAEAKLCRHLCGCLLVPGAERDFRDDWSPQGMLSTWPFGEPRGSLPVEAHLKVPGVGRGAAEPAKAQLRNQTMPSNSQRTISPWLCYGSLPSCEGEPEMSFCLLKEVWHSFRIVAELGGVSSAQAEEEAYKTLEESVSYFKWNMQGVNLSKELREAPFLDRTCWCRHLESAWKLGEEMRRLQNWTYSPPRNSVSLTWMLRTCNKAIEGHRVQT